MSVALSAVAWSSSASTPPHAGIDALRRRAAAARRAMPSWLVGILLGIAVSACDPDRDEARELLVTIDQPVTADEWVLPAGFATNVVVEGTVSESPRGPIESQECKTECSGWPCLFPVQTCRTTYAPRVRVSVMNEATAEVVPASITVGSSPYRWGAFPVFLRPGVNRLVAVAEDGESRAEDVLVITVP